MIRCSVVDSGSFRSPKYIYIGSRTDQANFYAVNRPFFFAGFKIFTAPLRRGGSLRGMKAALSLNLKIFIAFVIFIVNLVNADFGVYKHSFFLCRAELDIGFFVLFLRTLYPIKLK